MKSVPKPNLSSDSSANPPQIHEHHVRLPDQVSEILRAKQAHSRGLTGKGIRIAVIDSGFFPHPYYDSRGYKITRVPTRKEPHPQVDEYGHGTAQLASLFAIAPEAEVLAIKCMDRDPSYALEKAIALKPHILNCAWGFNIDRCGNKMSRSGTRVPMKVPAEYRKMQRLIRKATRDGICVVAAAGNGQYAFPGNMPEVISAGGVYYSPEGSFELSDVSSYFVSSMFPGRLVPDVCGLVGNLPYGRLLLVPVPPKARLAKRPGFSTIAAGEAQTVLPAGKAPGWAMFSGTSAATAMISGAAAILLQANPTLNPEEIKRCLRESALPVGGSTSARVLAVELALQMIRA